MTSVTLDVVYEDPSQVVKGLNKLKEMLAGECDVVAAPSWLIASCRDMVLKCAVVLGGDIMRLMAPARLRITIEGEAGQVVRGSRLVLAVAQATGGGVTMG
mgnify:FL=1